MSKNKFKPIHLSLALSIGVLISNPVWLNAGSNTIMKIGSRTSQPIGHYEYCQSNGIDCSIKSHSISPPTLTRKRWQEMVETNAETNFSIKPITDLEFYGVEEHWTFPSTHGDCEDYVLLKRHKLMKMGWPASALLVTVVRQKSGDGHAVLTVRTNRGDYILDNLNDRIEAWNNTEYTYLKRVSPRNSGWWEEIIDTRQTVGAISK